MPAELKRRGSRGIGTTPTRIGATQATPNAGYSIPNGASAALKGITVTPRNGVPANVTITLYDGTNTAVSALVEMANIPGGDALIFDKTDFMEAGDYIVVVAHAGTVDALMSFAVVTP